MTSGGIGGGANWSISTGLVQSNMKNNLTWYATPNTVDSSVKNQISGLK